MDSLKWIVLGDIVLTFVQSAVLRDLPVCFNSSELARVSLAAEGIYANKTYSLHFSWCFMSREVFHLQTVLSAFSTIDNVRSRNRQGICCGQHDIFWHLVNIRGFDNSQRQIYSCVLFQGKIKSLLMLCLTTTKIILGFIYFVPIRFTLRPSHQQLSDTPCFDQNLTRLHSGWT